MHEVHMEISAFNLAHKRSCNAERPEGAKDEVIALDAVERKLSVVIITN